MAQLFLSFAVACEQFRSVFSHPVWDTKLSEKIERTWPNTEKSWSGAKGAKNWCKPCGFLEFGKCARAVSSESTVDARVWIEKAIRMRTKLVCQPQDRRDVDRTALAVKSDRP